MNVTDHTLSRRARRRQSLSASALVALLVALLGLTSVPAFSAGGAAARSAAVLVPGTPIPLLAGPPLEQPTLVPERPRGAAASSTIIQVNYHGFSDEARAAYQRAVNTWAGLITSPVPIIIDARWQAFGPTVLGSGAPAFYASRFTGDYYDGKIFYPIALANSLAGQDLDPSGNDITTISNTNANWYYGTGATPAGQHNFTSAVLNQIAHGLAFSSAMSVDSSGIGSWGFGTGNAYYYDRFLYNRDQLSLHDSPAFPNNSAKLGAELTSGTVLFLGSASGVASGAEQPRLYAPSTWAQGASIVHLDEATYPAGNANALMTPFLSPGETILDPGPIALGILADLGWNAVVQAPASPSPAPSSPSPAPSASPVPSSSPAPMGPRFADVPTNHWAYGYIEELAAREITKGCTPAEVKPVEYCPDDHVTRAQMAVFLMRAAGVLEPPVGTSSYCLDVPPGYWAHDFIAEFARRGITDRCNPIQPREYYPDHKVTRAEMAAFLNRMKRYAPISRAVPTFADVPVGYWNYQDIEQMYEHGITEGCGDKESKPRYYCPEGFVTRAEMAAFVIRAFPQR